MKSAFSVIPAALSSKLGEIQPWSGRLAPLFRALAFAAAAAPSFAQEPAPDPDYIPPHVEEASFEALPYIGIAIGDELNRAARSRVRDAFDDQWDTDAWLAATVAGTGAGSGAGAGFAAYRGEESPSRYRQARSSPFALWGQGYYNRLTLDEPGRDNMLRGDVAGAIVGFDARTSERALAGLSMTDAVADLEYQRPGAAGGAAAYKTRIRGIHPYFAWRGDSGGRAWMTFGYGVGDAEMRFSPVVVESGAGMPGGEAAQGGVNAQAGGAAQDGDEAEDGESDNAPERPCPGVGAGEYECKLEFLSYAFGGYAPVVWTRGYSSATTIGVLSDLAVSQVTKKKTEAHAYEAGRARLGAVMEYEYLSERGSSVGGELELALRGDFGDIATGAGLEAGGKLRVSVPRIGLRMNLNARGLINHNHDVRDWGVASSISMTSVNSRGRSLSLAFSPRWGTAGFSGDGGINGFGADGGFNGFSSFGGDGGINGIGGNGFGSDGGAAASAHAAGYRLTINYALPLANGRHLLNMYAHGDAGRDTDALTVGADLTLSENLRASYAAHIGRIFPATPSPVPHIAANPAPLHAAAAPTYHRYDPTYDHYLNPFTRPRPPSPSTQSAPSRPPAKASDVDHRVYLQYEKQF